MAENTTTRVVEVQVDNAEAIKLIADYNAKIEESTAKEKSPARGDQEKGRSHRRRPRGTGEATRRTDRLQARVARG